MFKSTKKILLCVLLLCIQFALLTIPKREMREKCADCIPIKMCNAATKYRMDPTPANLELIRTKFCGLTNSLNVCCSKFKQIQDVRQDEHPNLKLLPNSCGKVFNTINFRIITGSFASMYEFPWMVLISYDSDGKTEFKCSGTLINPRYVLTAAHCVKNLIIIGVRVGEYHIGVHPDCEESVCEYNIQDITVKRFIVHSSYEIYPNYKNDIALLRLSTDVNMIFKNTGAICLPTTKELQEGSIANRSAVVAGWGVTEHGREAAILLKVILPIQSNEECRQYHSNIPEVNSTQFCAGKLNKDSCKGDSGGPLMMQDNYNGEDKYVQYGIVSHGPTKCGSDAPGVYTDVRKYVTWILDSIEE